MTNVALLFGGISTEHEISQRSATNVVHMLADAPLNLVLIGITRDGQWLHYTGDVADIATDAWETHDCTPVVLTPGKSGSLSELKDGVLSPLLVDVVLPVLHGQGGEDGVIQGALETCGIAYVGCGVMSSAVCMDKDASHRVATAYGIRSPQCAVAYRDAEKSQLLEGTISEALRASVERCGGYPVFVKPARGGSSIGVSKAHDEHELIDALLTAFETDPKAAIEEFIQGIEVGCSLIGDAAHGTEMGDVDQIVVSGDGFFRIHLEKNPGANTELKCPADLPQEVLAKIKETATKIYEALDCAGFARVDLFVTPQNEVIFNEVNTIPGLTYYSRFPKMFRSVGRELDEVLQQLISDKLQQKENERIHA